MLMALALLPANTQRVRAKCTSTTPPFSNLSYWTAGRGEIVIASLAASVTGQVAKLKGSFRIRVRHVYLQQSNEVIPWSSSSVECQILEACKPQLRTREKAIKETQSYK
ncbi:hypothetical protein JB92DRAFT_3038753 [Gautieria morchelliformis]|nr:hypothetical protein JB92DRAFT_3038753 [Gautieria morchelliformis]